MAVGMMGEIVVYRHITRTAQQFQSTLHALKLLQRQCRYCRRDTDMTRGGQGREGIFNIVLAAV